MDVTNWDDGGDLSRFVYLHCSEFFPTAVIPRRGKVSELACELRPEIGAYELTLASGRRVTLDDFLANSSVDGFIVLHRGRIVYEAYPRMRQRDRHLTFSVTKAFIGTAVGILEDRGEIELGRGIDSYIPELKGTDWAGITVRDILEMASGMEGSSSEGKPFEDPTHKHYQLEASLGLLPLTPDLPQSARDGETYTFLTSLKRLQEPGKRWSYTSTNTAILGWLLERITNKPLAQVLSDEIWSHVGAESDALMVLNQKGIPVSHGGMATTLRDLARFGLLFTESWREVSQERVISEELLRRIQHNGRPELIAAVPRKANFKHVAYQWDGVTKQGALVKGGFGGQILVVFPTENVVVAYFATNEDVESKPEGPPLGKMVHDLFGERK